MTELNQETMQGLQFFEKMPQSVREQLARIAVLQEMVEGEVLFREGTLQGDLFVVIEGHVALEMSVPGRGSNRILTVGPSDLLAWSPLLSDGRMTATARALISGRLIRFPSDQLRQLCEADHEVGFHMMTQVANAMARRLLATRLQLLDLFSTQPPPVAPTPPVEVGE